MLKKRGHPAYCLRAVRLMRSLKIFGTPVKNIAEQPCFRQNVHLHRRRPDLVLQCRKVVQGPAVDILNGGGVGASVTGTRAVG